MPPLSKADSTLLIIVAIVGSLFFVAVCAAIYFLFQRLQRAEDEQDHKDSLPPDNDL